MNISLLASEITTLHDQSILSWKEHGIVLVHEGFMQLVEENHAFNYQLWHTEDRARRDDLGFEAIYQAKRSIDRFNQQRNNRMEAIDEWLFKAMQPEVPSKSIVHSETPGMMIDRLSILSLKAYHMGLQTERITADEAHRTLCMQKANVISEQKTQLQSCLHDLFHEVQQRTRTFRVYHQFKMYNDPTLNPELY